MEYGLRPAWSATMVDHKRHVILDTVCIHSGTLLCHCPLNIIELNPKYIQKTQSHPSVPAPSGGGVSMQGSRCLQMMPTHQKSGRWGCPFSLGCHCSFKTAGFPFLEITCLLKWCLRMLPSLLHHFFFLAVFSSH